MHQNHIKDTNNNFNESLLFYKEKLIQSIKRIKHELDECREAETYTYSEAQQVEEKLIQSIKRIKHELDECREAETYTYSEAQQVEYRFEYLEREVRAEFQNLHRFLDEEENRDMERLKREREKQVKLLKARERKIYEQGKDLERAIATLNAKLAEDDNPKLLKEIQDLIKRSQVRFKPPPEVDTEVRSGQFVGPIQYRIWKHMKSCLYPNITSMTFDPETAHPLLTLSPSLTSVWFDEDKVVEDCPANPRRFNYYYCLMGHQALITGRHYWEVDVAGKTAWRVGVARDDVKRGEMSSSGSSCGLWTLSLRAGTVVASTDPEPTTITVSKRLARIGVFLNCEEEEVSFYNAVTMAPLFTFSMGTVEVPLYPFYNPCDLDDGKNAAPINLFSPSL